MRVFVRMWTKEGYHKDVAILSESQVHMTSTPGVKDPTGMHLQAGIGISVVIDPKDFPEAVEFQVLVK